MTSVRVKLKLWQLPNFAKFDGQDGYVHISDMTDEQLSEMADEWKHALLKKARRLRAIRDGGGLRDEDPVTAEGR